VVLFFIGLLLLYTEKVTTMGCVISGLKDQDTIIKRMKFLADLHPDRELFVFHDGVTRDAYTAQRLFTLAGRFARHLKDLGFNKGDTIANTLPNCPERIVSDLGMMMAGCVSVNVQVLLADGSDFFHIANKSGCKSVILKDVSDLWKLLKDYSTVCDSSVGSFFKIAYDQTTSVQSAMVISREENSKCTISQLASHDMDVHCIDADPRDIAIIMATSGSTGFSKLIPYWHWNLIKMWDALVDFKTTTTPKDVIGQGAIFNDRPLGWAGGFPYQTYAYGTKRILVDYWDVKPLFKTPAFQYDIIEKEQCTVAMLLTAEIIAIGHHTATLGREHHKLKIVGTGGQPLKKHSFDEVYALTEDLLVLYGATEFFIASCASISETRMTTIANYYCGERNPIYEMNILDENGKLCPNGKVGTIFIKGDCMAKSYYNVIDNPDPASAAFSADGWFNTHDNGYHDNEGGIYVIGRQNDVIMHGSICVYPGWLEQRILNHPLIEEVVVVPVPDPVKFQEICACVMTEPDSGLTEEALEVYCKEIFLGDSAEGMTPMPEHFMIVTSLPRTATGKINRKALTKMAEEKFSNLK